MNQWDMETNQHVQKDKERKKGEQLMTLAVPESWVGRGRHNCVLRKARDGWGPGAWCTGQPGAAMSKSPKAVM